MTDKGGSGTTNDNQHPIDKKVLCDWIGRVRGIQLRISQGWQNLREKRFGPSKNTTDGRGGGRKGEKKSVFNHFKILLGTGAIFWLKRDCTAVEKREIG